MSRRSIRKHGDIVCRSMSLETLDARRVFSGSDLSFASAGSLTFSFAPDGTHVGQNQSELMSGLAALGSAELWQSAIARAFQTWTSHANINFGMVDDNGAASGVYGPTRGDERFGDIRFAGFDYSQDTLALAVSELTRSVGTWAGDVFFNTRVPWTNVQSLEAVALHEIGHVLGLPHSDNPLSPMHAHGTNAIVDLIAEDIAKLQSLHGIRLPDPSEGDHGNETISRAARIKGSDDDLSVVDGFDGSQVWIQFGDLTVIGDRDVYEIRTASNYSGPLAVEVRTQGISLAKPKASITDRFGTVLASETMTGTLGGNLMLQLPSTNRDGKYYLQIESGNDVFWNAGDYVISIASPTRFASEGNAIAEWAQSAHRWYYDSRMAKDGYSYHLRPDDGSQPILDDESHFDDRTENALPLDPMIVTTEKTVYQFVGTVIDATDIDHLQVTAPSNQRGVMDLTVDVEPLQQNGLVPSAQVLLRNGTVLPMETRVQGYGQFQIVVKNVTAREEYVIRVKTAGGAKFNTGNYVMQATFTTPAEPTLTLLQSELTKDQSLIEREWHVAKPQLFGLHLEASSTTLDPSAQVWLTVFDQNRRFLAGSIAPVNQLRTLPGLLLDSGTYFVQIAFRQNVNVDSTVQVQLKADLPSQPIGPLVGDEQSQPRFLCPGETDVYCYPTNPPNITPSPTSLGNPPLQPLPRPVPIPVVAPDDGWFWNQSFSPTNPVDALDANGDQRVTALDALMVINRLNGYGSGVYPAAPEYVGFLDTNRDGSISAIDALLVINFLNN